MIRKTEVLTLRLLRSAQSVAARFQSGIGFGEFAQWKHHTGEHILVEVVEEVALILAGVQAP